MRTPVGLIRPWILALLLAPVGLPAQEAPAVPGPDSLVVRAAALRQTEASLPFRLDLLSSALEGVPYQVSPLGEGAGQDPDPLVRWDAVDCLTYVEQVLALAQAPDPGAFLPILNDLRYGDGRPSWTSRNHLMMAQWVPHNLAKGWLTDVTRAVGGPLTRVAEKGLTAEAWQARRGVGLELPVSAVPLGMARLDYIPVDRFPEVMDRVPHGAILLVVREDRPTRPIRITHLGFVFRRQGRVWFRHAAKAGWGRVAEERLEDFVARNAAYRRWPVAGFAILAPAENPGRVAALTPPSPSAGSPGG